MAVRVPLLAKDLTTFTLTGQNYVSGVPTGSTAIALAGTSLFAGVSFSMDQGLVRFNGLDDLYAHYVKTQIEIDCHISLYNSTDATLGDAILNLMTSFDLVKVVATYNYNGTTRTLTYTGIWEGGDKGITQIAPNMSSINLKPINNANASPLVIT